MRGSFESQLHSEADEDRLSSILKPLNEGSISHSFQRAISTKLTRRKQSSASSSFLMFTSSRSPSSERLEGGHGPAQRYNIMRRFAWKKFAIGAAVLIGVVWIAGPRESRYAWGGGQPSIPAPGHYQGIHPEDDYDMLPPPKHDKAKDPSSHDHKVTVPPTSPETDPDPLETVYCTTPYKVGVPIVQYALMIDAGSRGSRIHIYKFNNCGASPVYEYEVFKQRQPGLSDYKDSPQGAAESLDELLDEAARVVPQSLWACTPVAVKATAGLRLLGAVESTDILQAVRQRLREKYSFNLRSDDDVVIMDGKDEGVFAWITVNYLLKTIRADTPSDTSSYAVLDLGGASTQIVFEPVFDEKRPDSMLEEGEHKYELGFGGKKRVLYQHSYLGYGLMQARESVHRLVEFLASAGDIEHGVIANPCLAQGTTKNVTLEDMTSRQTRNITMDGADVGGFEACTRVVQLIMAKDAVCPVKPCSFSGVYQPSLLETFARGKVMLLSYFFDRTYPLLTQDEVSNPIRISTIANLAQDVCVGGAAWSKRWGQNAEAMAELEGRPEWCLDLTFIHSLLRLGYEFSDDREAEIGKKIEGTELGWCLGATIAMVGADLKCRV